MPQAAVAYRERIHAEFFQYCFDDAGTGQDHLCSAGLQADDGLPLFGRAGTVLFDLVLDIAARENRTLNRIRVVGSQAEFHRDHVGDSAAHTDECIGHGRGIEPGQIGADGGERLVQCRLRDRFVKCVAFGKTGGTHVETKAIIDGGAMSEGELCATAAAVKHDQRDIRQAESRLVQPGRRAALPLRRR